MTVNVGGLIMVRKEGWLAENPLSSINPTVPALLKRGRKQLCSRVGPFECTAVTQAITTEKRGSSVHNRSIGCVEINSRNFKLLLQLIGKLKPTSESVTLIIFTK